MYSCPVCGVVVTEPIKTCDCDAGLIANLQATLVGNGGFSRDDQQRA